MRVHLIYAHPASTSFTAAVHDRILSGLRTQAHQIDELDLYGAHFNPVLSLAKYTVYVKPGDNLAGIEDYVERLRAAEALVLCFPTWWYGMPAILKGWFDRVWATGVAFTLPEGGGAIRPALHNIRKFAVVTTYGSPWRLMKLVLRDPVRAVLISGLRRLCARDCRGGFLALSNIDGATPAPCARFLARGGRTIAPFLEPCPSLLLPC